MARPEDRLSKKIENRRLITDLDIVHLTYTISMTSYSLCATTSAKSVPLKYASNNITAGDLLGKDTCSSLFASHCEKQ